MSTGLGWKRRVRPFLVKANAVPLAFHISRGIHFAALRVLVPYLAQHPAVRSVYLRHSMLGSDFIPWRSDIDLDLVLDDSADSPDVWREVRERVVRAKGWFPSVGEAEIFCERELRAWVRHGGLEALDVLRWRRLRDDMPR